MTIESIIRKLLFENLKESANKERDINLTLFYFGFMEEKWPTYEDAYIRFNIGDPENENKRERPRQIVKKLFKDAIDLQSIAELQIIEKIFSESIFDNSEHLENKLIESGLVDENFSIKGLLNILQLANYCLTIDLYTNDLIPATRNSIKKAQNTFILNINDTKEIQSTIHKLKTYPGQVGIASLDLFLSTIDYDKTKTNLIDIYLYNKSDAWVTKLNGDTFYIIEDSDNTLINRLQKIKNIVKSTYITDLSQAIFDSFKSRTAPKNNKYPPLELVEKYIKNSKYIESNENTCNILIDKKPLQQIEIDTVQFLKNKGSATFTELREYLTTHGYSQPNINKTVLNSPLVLASRNNIRKSRDYRLLKTSEEVQSTINNRYYLYKNKLLNACTDGTDNTTKGRERKEQAILRNWLFENKKTETCAICGKEFSIFSLVTAHKKPRAICSFNERIDPYVVMPLCKFGCDHLYELRNIKIVDKKIISTPQPDLTQAEHHYLVSVNGKEVNELWLRGDLNYFN